MKSALPLSLALWLTINLSAAADSSDGWPPAWDANL